MLGHQLDKYPYLLAYPARQYANAVHFAERLTLQHQLVEAVVAALGVIALGWCRTHQGDMDDGTGDAVGAWHTRLGKGGVTLGVWIMAIRAAVKRMSRASADPVAGVFRSVATPELMRGLEEFQKIRNSYAHGAVPRSSMDQRASVEQLHPGISAIFDRLAPITRLRLGIVRSSVKQGRLNRIETDLLTATEPFPTRLLHSSRNFRDGVVLGFCSDDLEDAIELDPYCIWRQCRFCGRDEPFYLRQRRKGARLTSCYVSFSTGHELLVTGDVMKTSKPPTALAINPLSPTDARPAGWRTTWADLAGRGRRLLARIVDLLVVTVAAATGWLVSWLLGSPTWAAVLCATILALAYEPAMVVVNGSLGKRLLRLEPIGCLDGRALADVLALRRALLVDLALIFPPLAIRNLAWLLWDPARQCWHDRGAVCVVVAGRSRPGQKR